MVSMLAIVYPALAGFVLGLLFATPGVAALLSGAFAVFGAVVGKVDELEQRVEELESEK